MSGLTAVRGAGQTESALSLAQRLGLNLLAVATPALTDSLLIYDDSGSANAKCTVQSIVDLAGSGIAGLTDNRLVKADGADAIQNTGITVSDTDVMTGLGGLTLNPSGGHGIITVDVADDAALILDGAGDGTGLAYIDLKGNGTILGNIAIDAGDSGTSLFLNNSVTGGVNLCAGGGNVTVTNALTVGTTLGVTGLATLASVDINGGNIDGTVIGASSAAAATVSSLSATTCSVAGALKIGSTNTAIGNDALATFGQDSGSGHAILQFGRTSLGGVSTIQGILTGTGVNELRLNPSGGTVSIFTTASIDSVGLSLTSGKDFTLNGGSITDATGTITCDDTLRIGNVTIPFDIKGNVAGNDYLTIEATGFGGEIVRFVGATLATTFAGDVTLASGKDLTLNAGSISDSSGNVDIADSITLSGGVARTITTDTTDASDSASIQICGGGAIGVARGGSIFVAGNENANTGDVHILSGNHASAAINLFTGNGSEVGRFDQHTTADEFRFQAYVHGLGLRRFLVEAADSAGTGYRNVRVAN